MNAEDRNLLQEFFLGLFWKRRSQEFGLMAALAC
jgi:hypothetical protein